MLEMEDHLVRFQIDILTWAGNYVAIGTFDPQIEIWDLDVIDAVFPEVILGQIPSANAGIKSGKSKHGKDIRHIMLTL